MCVTERVHSKQLHAGDDISADLADLFEYGGYRSLQGDYRVLVMDQLPGHGSTPEHRV